MFVMYIINKDNNSDETLPVAVIGAVIFACVVGGITLLEEIYNPSIKPMDVYQGKTTLKYEVIDGVKVDSVSFGMEKSVVHKNFKLDKRIVDRFFSPFSLERVEKCWYNALKALNAQSAEEGMTERERKDIGFGIEVLRDEWMDTQKHLRITGEAIDNYQEVFRTKGEMKKALREIADMDNEIEEENLNARKRRIINC